MSLTNGLEYISTTKKRIRTQIQGKGITVDDSTPFSKYPDVIDNELKSKAWQYPSDWFQLTPKSEFPDHTLEMVVFDAEYEFSFYVYGRGTGHISILGNDGTFKLNNIVKSLNTSYTLSSGKQTIQLNRGTGVASNSTGFTTLKIVIYFTTALVNFYPCPVDNTYKTHIPILAFRAKDTTTASSKIIYFGSGDTSNAKGIPKYMQYCDLSMVTHLLTRSYQFYDCSQLVKCELPDNFTLSSYAFYKNENLKEVVGYNAKTIYTDRTHIFAHCTKFKPPSFNYAGGYCYSNCDLGGLTINLPSIITHYPEFFITMPSSNVHLEDGHIPKVKIVVPDTVKTMSYLAFCGLQSEAIIHLPSAEVTLVDEPDLLNSSESFLQNPFMIENGENFYVETPISVRLNGSFSQKEVYLPHAPLSIFIADCSPYKGNLENITFDWTRTTFNTVPENYLGYVIDLKGNNFNRSALVKLFNNLPTVNVPRNIRVTDNPGAASLSNKDIGIVIDKGYILTK